MTMYYTPTDVAWITRTMQRVATTSELEFGVDIRPLPNAANSSDPFWCTNSGGGAKDELEIVHTNKQKYTLHTQHKIQAIKLTDHATYKLTSY